MGVCTVREVDPNSVKLTRFTHGMGWGPRIGCMSASRLEARGHRRLRSVLAAGSPLASLFLVVRPGAPSSVLAPSSDASQSLLGHVLPATPSNLLLCLN